MDKLFSWLTEKLKEPHAVVLLILGALLVVLGISTKVEVPVLKSIAADQKFRWVAIALGLLLMAASFLIFRWPRAGGEGNVEILRSSEEVRRVMKELVEEAGQILVCCGSRSRDKTYLDSIEAKLRETPQLVHYRILMGPPHRNVLKDHLLHLLADRDPKDRTYGVQTLHVALYDHPEVEPERFVCANEKGALVVLPPFSAPGRFDSAVVFRDPSDVQALCHYVTSLYGAGDKLETEDAVRLLQVRFA